MEQYNVVKFLNQFMKTVKQGSKNIGIITDKDGTLFLNYELKEALNNLRNKELGVNIYIIINSGRTVQDIINCLKQEKIPIDYFDYIIGDNGAMCIDAKNEKQLYKSVMERETVLKVIQKFIEIGGTLSNIRLSNGKNIFAYPSKKVKDYYKGDKDSIFKMDMLDLSGLDITKLTLTGPHEQIKEINEFIRENIKEYKTHMGKTLFPDRLENNYRLDFTRNAYKRRSCRRFKKTIVVRYMYLFWK